MNNEQQPQATPDDPSGDGWRDVRPDEILQADDMAQWDHGWSRARVPGIIAGSYPRYRRRIEQQQPQPQSEITPDAPIGEGSSVDTLPDPPFTPDDPSGPALTWLDVEVGDKLRYGDIFRAFGKWKYAKNIGVTVSEEWKGKYRRIGPHPPQAQPSDSEPGIVDDLRQRLAEAEALVAEAERGGQQVQSEMQKLRKQLHESQRTAQRYRNQLEGAWEHAPKGPRNFRERMVLEKFRAFVEAKDDDPLTFGYVQLRATDPHVLGCSEFVVESWHEDVGGGRLSESVRVFLRHYASEEDQESRKEISARTYFHVRTVGDYERLLSLLGIGGQTE